MTELIDRGAELVDVRHASRAQHEVLLETLLGLGVQGAVEVGGDELDELLTGQMGWPSHLLQFFTVAEVVLGQLMSDSGPGAVQQHSLVDR